MVFRVVQDDDTTLSHANQVKNILAQIGVAIGTIVATLGLQWRTAFHQARLFESVPITSPELQSQVDASSQYFATTHDPATASQLAVANFAVPLSQESTLLACLDYFTALEAFAATYLVLVATVGTFRVLLRPESAKGH